LVPVALNTSRVEIGTSIAVAFARTPMTVANLAWDLQAASNGRMIVGLGSQIKPHIEKRFSMPWSHPAARMREYILAMRAIFDTWQNGTKLDFRGDYYTHTLMTPMFNPGPLACGAPKIVLAAVGTAMTEVAAEVSDGVLLHGFTTERYAREVTMPAVERVLERVGRDRSAFEVKYAPFVVTGRDEHEMAASAKVAKERIAFYGSTPAYRGVLELHGWGELQTELNQLSKQGQWVAMGERVDDEVLAAFAVVAPIDELGSTIARRVAGVADRTSLHLPKGVDASMAGSITDTIRRTGN
jgi:probable F420-dependent oxidoreductase